MKETKRIFFRAERKCFNPKRNSRRTKTKIDRNYYFIFFSATCNFCNCSNLLRGCTPLLAKTHHIKRPSSSVVRKLSWAPVRAEVYHFSQAKPWWNCQCTLPVVPISGLFKPQREGFFRLADGCLKHWTH